jgi:hypothetical protein
VKPDLQFSLLCDEVRREDNGKLMLIGLFEVIGAPEFPLMYPGMAIVNRWTNGVGEFRQRIRLVDAENKVVVETPETVMGLRDMRESITTVVLLRGVRLPQPGRYSVEILLDGDLKQRYALNVARISLGAPPEPGAGPQG